MKSQFESAPKLKSLALTIVSSLFPPFSVALWENPLQSLQVLELRLIAAKAKDWSKFLHTDSQFWSPLNILQRMDSQKRPRLHLLSVDERLIDERDMPVLDSMVDMLILNKGAVCKQLFSTIANQERFTYHLS